MENMPIAGINDELVCTNETIFHAAWMQGKSEDNRIPTRRGASNERDRSGGFPGHRLSQYTCMNVKYILTNA